MYKVWISLICQYTIRRFCLFFRSRICEIYKIVLYLDMLHDFIKISIPLSRMKWKTDLHSTIDLYHSGWEEINRKLWVRSIRLSNFGFWTIKSVFQWPKKDIQSCFPKSISKFFSVLTFEVRFTYLPFLLLQCLSV